MPIRFCAPLVLFALLAPAAMPADTAPAANAALTVALVNGNYEITLPRSKLLLRIPENHLAPGGGPDSPAYFELSSATPNLIVTGWFEPAGNYEGAQKLWKGDAKAMTDGGLPAPRNIVFLKRGPWEIITYHIPLPQGASAHLRAELVQAGTWLDLHLSITSGQPVAAAREKLLAVLQGITVEEK
jgi:hypothetical protein